jgi:hypothetical protein
MDHKTAELKNGPCSLILTLDMFVLPYKPGMAPEDACGLGIGTGQEK